MMTDNRTDFSAAAGDRREFPADVKMLGEVTAFVLDGEADLPAEARMALELALEEFFVNVADYAYNGADGPVRVWKSRGPRSLTVMLEDEGVPYDPLQQPEPNLRQDLADRPVGGLGILLARKSVDRVEYHRCGSCNRLTFRKDW